ncbi:MAG TPA: hypothetical protein VF331_04885 [Polyangiales bacterium]
MRAATLIVGLWACFACASVGMLVAAPSVARAEPSDYDHFINDALQAFDAGRWAEARTLFRRAHELEPTARTLRTIGMCSFNLGDYADALRSFDAALAETRKPLTGEQRGQLQELSERSSQKLGRFRLQLSPETATVRVDTAEAVLLTNKELLLEPGKHDVAASADGYATEHREVVVEAGDRATLQLYLNLQPTAAVSAALPLVKPAARAPVQASPAPTMDQVAAPAQVPEPLPRKPSTRQHGSATRKTIAYVGLAVGAVAMAAFGVTAGLAAAQQAKLDERCPGRRCGPASYGTLDTYEQLKTVSSISLIAGGALLSLSTVLLLTGGEPVSAEHARLEPMLGWGMAGVRGQL